MNYSFSTGAERIAVLEDIRKPEVYFPRDWDPRRSRQKQSPCSLFYTFSHVSTCLPITVISSLLRHDPAERPTALELSQSSLLPPRVEDEYFRGALRMMSLYISV